MLTKYSAHEVGVLAERLEGMARTLRIIQGRMLTGQDVSEVKWNDQTFLGRLAEVEHFFSGMVDKYERESQANRRRKEKEAADKKRAVEVGAEVHEQKSKKKS